MISIVRFYRIGIGFFSKVVRYRESFHVSKTKKKIPETIKELFDHNKKSEEECVKLFLGASA